MTPSCDNCRFSFDIPSTSEKRVECRRFPPQFHPLTAVPLIPAVLPDFWCGEFVEWPEPVREYKLGEVVST